MGDFVDHDFTEIPLTGGGYFGSAHGIKSGLLAFEDPGRNLLGLDGVALFHREPVGQRGFDFVALLFRVAIARKKQVHFSFACHIFVLLGAFSNLTERAKISVAAGTE
jgi:hypothetical protein